MVALLTSATGRDPAHSIAAVRGSQAQEGLRRLKPVSSEGAAGIGHVLKQTTRLPFAGNSSY